MPLMRAPLTHVSLNLGAGCKPLARVIFSVDAALTPSLKDKRGAPIGAAVDVNPGTTLAQPDGASVLPFRVKVQQDVPHRV